MRFLLKSGWIAAFSAAVFAATAQAAESVDRLRALAERAHDRAAWPALREYAEAERNPERRGRAYLLLGYRQFEAKADAAAMANLGRAAATAFSLADFADFYRARAAERALQPEEALAALDRFSVRYPRSVLRFEALELQARLLLGQKNFARALEVLLAEPRTRQRPPLALLLARAYRDAGENLEAARVFQEIFYAHPVAPEALEARTALLALRSALGEAFPEVPEEIRDARASLLLARSRFIDALQDYESLLKARPESPRAARWKLGQARSLMALRRVSEAAKLLASGFEDGSEVEAERLALLVEARARLNEEPGMLTALDELRRRFPHSAAQAAALSAVGAYYVRQGDWKSASVHYRALAEGFPQSPHAAEAHWRVAWAHHLAGEEATRSAFLDHLNRYPDSRYVPAALYWLARIYEERRAWADARFLFELLAEHYALTYYASEAQKRLVNLPQKPAAREKPSEELVPLRLRVGARQPPPLPACLPSDAPEVLRPFRALASLSLEALADRYLRLALELGPPLPRLQLALAEFEMRRERYGVGLFAARRLAPDYSRYRFDEMPEVFWRALYPRAFWGLIRREARANELDPYLMMALVRQESAFDPRATSRADARGLMQVLPRTAAQGRPRSRVARRLYDPAYNVRVGCRYFSRRLREFGNRVEFALAAYNAGASRVKRWTAERAFSEPAEFFESLPFSETRLYIENVLRDAEIYRRLLKGEARFANCQCDSGRCAPSVQE